MSAHLRTTLVLAVGLIAGGAGGFWYARASADLTQSAAVSPANVPINRTILYYRDPGGAPSWSATPRKDAHGHDYLPVYDDAEVSFDPAPKKPATAEVQRRILYYRNPMGLPDVSPVQKKDSMGMDYIPVYEGEEADGKTVKLSLGKVQRSGARTETVAARAVGESVRAVGTVAFDERRLTIVTLRADGYIEDLFVNATGQPVRAGQPLFRLYSSQIQQAQIDLMVAVRAVRRGIAGPDADRSFEGAMQRLRNLDVPETRIREVSETGTNPRTIDWPAPASGTVISKRIINGQRVTAGDELYRIADLSHVWVIADVAEHDLAAIKVGMKANITFHAYPTEQAEGEVTFIYPELKVETRTARVRIEFPNPNGRLRADMYADVVFHPADHTPVTAVPTSAVIDSGTRQVVLVAKGEGRFEPRPVKLGRRDGSYIEVIDGVAPGEEVVTAATFLIDAESNLRAALQAFTQEAPK